MQTETALQAHVPVAHRVIAQRIDVLRKDARLVRAGLRGGASLQADERRRRSGGPCPYSGPAVPLIDIGRVGLVVIECLYHLVDAAVVEQVAPTDQRACLIRVDPACRPTA